MAANKRTKAQRETDKKRLAELMREGKTQQEIADVLGVSRAQISLDMKSLSPVFVEEAKAVLAGSALEAAMKIREVAFSPYSVNEVGLAGIRLRAACEVLDRIGLPKATKSDVNLNANEFTEALDLLRRIGGDTAVEAVLSDLAEGGAGEG
jgi:transcriptional regulator with XRE-family HTH domain